MCNSENNSINNKIIAIEDINGNTIMGFELDESGNIIQYKNCEIADITDDDLFGTKKLVIRIQTKEEDYEY